MAKVKAVQEDAEQPIVMEGQDGILEMTEPQMETDEVPNVEVPEGTNGIVPENTNEAPEVAVNEVEVRKVKIHTLDEIDCIVAGNHISLRKDKDVEVSADVAAILCYSKKAYRL